MRGPVIAVDGPAASGKGTLARRLARAFGVPYLDTGLLYRAVARTMLDHGHDTPQQAVAIAGRLQPADLDRTDLRTPAADHMASRVAAWPELRQALLDRQRDFARASGGLLDGRDIGTVVFPDADAKLFVTASALERARRRLLQRGEAPTADALDGERRAIETRDRADAERASAPLRQADDAHLLDTTALDAEQTFQAALAIVRDRLARRSPNDHFAR